MSEQAGVMWGLVEGYWGGELVFESYCPSMSVRYHLSLCLIFPT